MGVVFRARDSKLLRDVAIKLLPDHFAEDSDRLSRLHREAQLLASVNHPNIAQIYGLEQVGSAGCIVMELVEGETLEQKLANGPLPLDEALEIARQVADALSAAHERGIVHRDLKPANIKLTPNGIVKVLDFGLAKAFGDRAQDRSQLSTMPTKLSGSIAGAVVGTPAYMSPEQARGKEVDARTDIWAFGCVLYEMLTGRQAFEGETVTDMLAKIVSGRPDMSLLPADTPHSIRLLLDATLNKNAQQRLQHIGDMRLFLDAKYFPAAAAETEVSGARRSGTLWMAAAAAVALIAGLLSAALYLRSPRSLEMSRMQFEIPIPTMVGFLSVSPDGQRIAYVSQPPDEMRALWIRDLATDSAQKLPGTENAGGFLWSPDGRYLAFLADGKLKKIDSRGGPVQVICDLPAQIRGVSWNRQGVILLAKGNTIASVSDQGGQPTPVTEPDTGRKESLHAVPVFLPDGNHYIYVIVSSVPENAGIFVGSLDSKTTKRLMPLPNRINGMAYASGYLLIAGDSLNAWRLDPDRLTIDAQPVLLADGLDGNFSVSDTGLLFYRKGASGPPVRQLTWYTRSGRQDGTIPTPPASYGSVELSPAGDRAAVDVRQGNSSRDIWIVDLKRAVPSRITFDSGDDWSPSWSADGSRIIFASTRGNSGTHIYQKSSSGAGNDEVVYAGERNEVPVHWSPDGRHVVFSQLRPGGNASYDTWLLNMADKKTSPFVESPFDKTNARVSPDGHLMAYATNDSGMYQVVVQTFPDPNGGRWQITAQGGSEPKWRRDSRELYYLAFDGKLMAVTVQSDHTFGTPTALFETPLTVNRTQANRDRRYDVAPDGRFLFAVLAGTAAQSANIAVVNWTAGLAKGN